MKLRRTAAGGEFLERHAPFRFEADVNERGVVFDRDHPSLDDGAFETVGDAKRLIEQRGETLFRGDFGGFGCYGHSFSSIPDHCDTAPPGSQRSGRPAGNRVRPHQPGPANRQEHDSTAARQPKAPAVSFIPKLTAVGGKRA